MESDELYEKQLLEIRKFCKGQPLKFFFDAIVDCDTVDAAINKVRGWKDTTLSKTFSPAAVKESGTMFALYRDLATRHSSRSMIWKKGLDSKMFNMSLVQAKNLGLGDK